MGLIDNVDRFQMNNNMIHLITLFAKGSDTFTRNRTENFILNHHSIIINVIPSSMCRRCHMTLEIYVQNIKCLCKAFQLRTNFNRRLQKMDEAWRKIVIVNNETIKENQDQMTMDHSGRAKEVYKENKNKRALKTHKS